METWDELDNEENSDKDEEQTNIALMDLTSLETKSNSDSGSEFEEDDEVFSKLSRSYLITFIQDLMGRCQDKAIYMGFLKKQYDLLKDELKSSQNKNESL